MLAALLALSPWTVASTSSRSQSLPAGLRAGPGVSLAPSVFVTPAGRPEASERAVFLAVWARGAVWVLPTLRFHLCISPLPTVTVPGLSPSCGALVYCSAPGFHRVSLELRAA